MLAVGFPTRAFDLFLLLEMVFLDSPLPYVVDPAAEVGIREDRLTEVSSAAGIESTCSEVGSADGADAIRPSTPGAQALLADRGRGGSLAEVSSAPGIES